MTHEEKEVIINCDGYYPQCPHCYSDIGGYGKTNYCPDCGGKIKWFKLKDDYKRED